MRRARPEDIPILLALMSEFYREAGYGLDHRLAESAFSTLLSDERLGYVWLFEDRAKPVGYVVLTLRFGMEYGGWIACIDDLFVVAESRNKGLSSQALVHVRDYCKSVGIRAITVEVGYNNGPAQAVYRRLGLTEAPDRQVLALGLAPPTHRV
jgi:GNAT superfamily N-acetyltransferase